MYYKFILLNRTVCRKSNSRCLRYNFFNTPAASRTMQDYALLNSDIWTLLTRATRARQSIAHAQLALALAPIQW